MSGLGRAAALAALALSLAACGRAGPLEPPPGPAASASPSSQLSPSEAAPGATLGNPITSDQAAQKNGFDSRGNPVAAPGQKRPFLLDPLLQ